MKNIITLKTLFLLPVIFICSCGPYHDYQTAEKAIASTQKNINLTLQHQQKIKPPVVIYHRYYVDTKPISFHQPPRWLNRHIRLNAKRMPLKMLERRILRNTNTVLDFDSDVNPNQQVSIHYNGNIKGALDDLASRTNETYEVNGRHVTWTNMMTRTYNISFMPGTSSYLVGKTTESVTHSSQSSSDDGGSGSAVMTTHSNLGDDQYSNLQASVSLWHDLKETLSKLKSPHGKVVISEATTTVTVHDYPNNVRAIQRYIEDLNRNLSKQVSIRVRVLEVSLDKNFAYGIDWNLLARSITYRILGHDMHGHLAFTAPLATASNLAGMMVGNTMTGGLASLQLGKDFSNAILRALAEQGKVRVVTQPTIVTMNNQVAEVRITNDTSYLESVNSTIVSNGGTTTSLTPGIVTDGFNMYLLPKIQGDKIFLQISSTMSTLTSLNKVDNVPTHQNDREHSDQRKGLLSSLFDGDTHRGDHASTTSFQAIQVPTLAQKHFNQRSVLRSGSTLIVAGFKRLRDATKESTLAGIHQLGGHGGVSRNTETIVLITPVILRN